MEQLKYRTTLNDFRNRLKPFRKVKSKDRQSNISKLDNKLRVLLFINASMDIVFYNKLLYYHSMCNDDLYNSDIIDLNWGY